MCSRIQELSTQKSMGSKWPVVLLVIVTLFFANPGLAESQVRGEFFNASNEVCHRFGKRQQDNLVLVRVNPGGGQQHPVLHAYFQFGHPNRDLQEQGRHLGELRHPDGYSTETTLDPGNSSFTKSSSGESIWNFYNSFVTTLLVGLIFVLIFGSHSLHETSKVVRLLKEKVVGLNCNLWKITFAYHCLLDDFHKSQKMNDEAEVKIRNLEQELLLKTQAVSEVEGLLNDSMVMATDEAEEMKRRTVSVEIKYRQAMDALKNSKYRSKKLIKQLDSMANSNLNLHKKLVGLEQDVGRYKDLYLVERNRHMTFGDFSNKSLGDNKQLQQQPLVSNSAPPKQDQVPSDVSPKKCFDRKDLMVIEKDAGVEHLSLSRLDSLERPESSSIHLSPEISDDSASLPLPKKKKRNFFKRTWAKVFSGKSGKSSSKKVSVEMKWSSRSQIKECEGPRPP